MHASLPWTRFTFYPRLSNDWIDAIGLKLNHLSFIVNGQSKDKSKALKKRKKNKQMCVRLNWPFDCGNHIGTTISSVSQNIDRYMAIRLYAKELAKKYLEKRFIGSRSSGHFIVQLCHFSSWLVFITDIDNKQQQTRANNGSQPGEINNTTSRHCIGWAIRFWPACARNFTDV